uniref:Uncharacterized protein n=2 Tax=Meloidogyne TaxID=189290 RepID=A0A6V7XCI6_MELEN|nr:unnamed protein product [Meloidogyne enterolobii]CAD2203839.1 unnamed protein product [Meloidogyne enterolobii]
MCLRPLPDITPERQSQHFVGHQWQDDHQHHQRQQLNRNLNRPWNLFEHLQKAKIGESEFPKITPLERKMIGMATTIFECSYLFVATFSALFSILRLKINGKLATMPIISYFLPNENT